MSRPGVVPHGAASTSTIITSNNTTMTTTANVNGGGVGGGGGCDVRDRDLHYLHATLNEYLLLEHKFQPRLCLPDDSNGGDNRGEVTTGARDGAAHVMRCLKVWYELPVDVLINAVHLFDRFLTKMKVRPCHVPCITVACMNLAIEQHATPRQVSVEELVSVSQSACTAGDVSRMSRVIADKLSLSGGASVSPLHWLRLYRRLFAAVADEEPCKLSESVLERALEIAVCDAACANTRHAELALVLLYNTLEKQVVSAAQGGAVEVPEHAYQLFDLAAQLQAHARMSDASLSNTRALVLAALARYEARSAAPQRQRLVWRLSERTLKQLRPTDRLRMPLPTIQEHRIRPAHRSDSESDSDSSETSDWPRSPVLPVYCDL